MTPTADRLDIDRLLREIREEVAARLPAPGQSSPALPDAGSTSGAMAPLQRLGPFAEDLPKKPRYHAADFLAFHDEDFIRQVYRRVLGREPDSEGASRHLAKIRSGTSSRIEVLGRIRYSPEGRAAAVPIDGLRLPFAVRMARRVPFVGRLLGILQYLWRLPDLARNHEVLESAVFANRTELHARVNVIVEEIERRLAGLHAKSRQLDPLAAETARIDAGLNELRASFARADGALGMLSSRLDTAFVRLDDAARERDEAALRVAALIDDMARTRRAVDAVRDGNQALAQRLARLPALDHLLDTQGRADRERPRMSTSSGEARDTQASALQTEGFYVEFEDRFRGTREDIKQRVAVYLPIVRASGAGTDDAPLLDIGCGRGEWLELLREENLYARGVDTNRVAVAGCQARGLDVVCADALDHLRALPDVSIGGISAIHVVEHLPFAQLIELFDESHRVLRQGGVAIFETPNPENVIVGACNFYYDPTHERPLPPEPLRFVLEACGFERVEIMRLHPDARNVDLSFLPSGLGDVLSQRLFGPQDYALIGFRR